MKVSLITTVLNEENSIKKFLDSVLKQTRLPEELVIVDGGSGDRTVARIKNHESRIKNLKVIRRKGNRSVGRNEAIKHSTGDIIAITDAGCILNKNWLKNITAPFVSKEVDVVAGYYKAKPYSFFEKCLVPYVLVMPERLDPDNFLPAARSIALRRSIWEEAGKFDEKLSHNEDYAFAKKLKQIGAKIVFEKDAIVYWIPRENLKDAFIMFFRFAFGDAEARIFRPKVLSLFIRYFLGIPFLIYFLILKLYFMLNILYIILFLYLLWAVFKNYRYVKKWQAIFVLPILQITSDIAIISGTTLGIIKNLWDTRKTL